VTRRDFFHLALRGLAGFTLGKGLLEISRPEESLASQPPVRWIFLVDTYKCLGCGFCVKACKLENEIPYAAKVSRTWVERYVLTKEGNILADIPLEGREGYLTGRIDLGLGRYQEITEKKIQKAFFVPKLCNQCANPPCVQVCPVGATYQAPDGVILVDRKWCIGCGYCIMACPYGMRFFHPIYRVAEKCNYCYHRITKGLKPACVLACPVGARKIGNSKNPDDPVAKTILTQRVEVHKDEYGTKPQVYYIGLSKEVR